MLNGRVYGGRRINAQNTNLFATAKDEDPEFVEWGYGGMGSVKSRSTGGSQWNRLQSGAAMGLKSPGSGTGGDGDEEDDGGGMAWVKKRKEQREKAKKEEEVAKRESEKAITGAKLESSGAPPMVHTEAVPLPSSEVESSSKDTTVEEPVAKPAKSVPSPIRIPPLPSEDIAVLSHPASPSAHPVRPSTATSTTSEEHRITTTIAVPAPLPHPHHHHRRSNSANMSQTSSTYLASGVDGERERGRVGERERTLSPLRSAGVEVDGWADDGGVGVIAGDATLLLPHHEKEEDEERDIMSRSESDSSSGESESESEGEDDDDDVEDEDVEAEVCYLYLPHPRTHVHLYVKDRLLIHTLYPFSRFERPHLVLESRRLAGLIKMSAETASFFWERGRGVFFT